MKGTEIERKKSTKHQKQDAVSRRILRNRKNMEKF